VSYISIRVPPDADAKQKESLRTRITDLVKQARGGKNFAELGKAKADDPLAVQGGDAGWISQGQMPPAIDKILFSLKKGEVSEPVEMPAGFQIFKIDDTKEEKTQTLKEAAPEITKSLRAEKTKREAIKIAERDREKAVSGVDFAKLAQESGAVAKITDWFASGETVPEIGQNQEFYKSAFALGPKEISSIIEGTNTYYFLRVKQRKEPAVPPLEGVRERIEKGLKDSKAYELALQKGNTLLEQLKKDKDIAKIAMANEMKVEETGWFVRSTPQLPKIGELAELRGGRITLSPQKPIADRLYTQKDAAYVIALKESQAADMEQFEKGKDNLRKQAVAESRQRALIKFLETLKGKANIKVNNAFLEES
jgi:peptidyl-prolyl cis-trans isomerase D